MYQVFRGFRWLVIVSLAALAGCASSVTQVDTWEGDAGTATPAVLKAPGAIEVIQVNGRQMSNFLLDDLALDYGLLPGQNQVVFNYKTIWAKNSVVKNGEPKVHIVESGPRAVQFEAVSGEVYRFEFEEPGSRRQAEAMKESFHAAIVASDGKEVARSRHWKEGEQPAEARVPALSSGISAEAQDTEEPTAPLARLKAIWAQASEDEKKAFLRWAFE
ncbi:DUF2057 domain-containing protein [Marinobacter fuscus]|uniref:DUF2057 domain-containing protein n=1 Tax=Marinobacter fuscus TaxID=2109942 RepID=A0A2T1K730_9GAMM|nr:DUF2057 family protein [Marinobacter fuscus]PSF05848.1 DUF2057 domain-containing protein [Marinobacter fuscus]